MFDCSSTANFHRKVVATIGALALVSGMAGTALALTLSGLDIQRIALFESKPRDSRFTIDVYETKVKGKTDRHLPHALQDGHRRARCEGDREVAGRQRRGPGRGDESHRAVAGGASVDLNDSFESANLALDYEETFIVVEDTD